MIICNAHKHIHTLTLTHSSPDDASGAFKSLSGLEN